MIKYIYLEKQQVFSITVISRDAWSYIPYPVIFKRKYLFKVKYSWPKVVLQTPVAPEEQENSRQESKASKEAAHQETSMKLGFNRTKFSVQTLITWFWTSHFTLGSLSLCNVYSVNTRGGQIVVQFRLMMHLLHLAVPLSGWRALCYQPKKNKEQTKKSTSVDIKLNLQAKTLWRRSLS